jgi:aryl carrier-like protein
MNNNQKEMDIELDVEAGDSVDIDELVEKFKEKGYQADYENLMSSSTGFWAKMTVSYSTNIVYIFISGCPMGHLIEKIER